MIKQAVVLCGGQGTRLGDLTKPPTDHAKIFEKPYLEYLLKAISTLPIDEIWLLAGYKGSEVCAYFEGKIINGVKINVLLSKNKRAR